MKRYAISLMLALLPSLASGQEGKAGPKQAGAEALTADSLPQPESRFDKRRRRARKHWDALIPRQMLVQNAGNMGLVSVGIGWEYGHRGQWETQILWGVIPKYNSTHAHLTNTVKENYIPWSVAFADRWAVEPLTASIYVNTVYGHEFWRSQPSRYPDKYYEMLSTKFRLNVAMGQRVTLITDPHKSLGRAVSLFYEVSTCDLYIRSLIQGTGISFWDILGLSVGVKFQLL